MVHNAFSYIVTGPLPRIRPVGISTGKIPDRNIKASSKWDRYHGANRARLNIRRHGRNRGGWSARRNDRRQWIQFDLKKPHRIVKVETQGRQDAGQWVTKFVVAYSQTGKRWTPYKKNSQVKAILLETACQRVLSSVCLSIHLLPVVQSGGWLPYITDGDARRNFQKQPLKVTIWGLAPANFIP